MQTIANNIGGSELQKLYDEGEKYDVAEVMKDIWTTDLDRQRREFSHDQASNSELIMIAYMYLSRQWWERKLLEPNHNKNG